MIPCKDSNADFYYMRYRTNKCIMLLVLSVLAACLSSVDAAPACQPTQCPATTSCFLVNQTIPTTCTELDFALYGCSIPAQNCFNTWDVSSVDSFEEMFYEAEGEINGLTNWNTSSGTNFYGMFADAAEFNQPLNWDTSSGIDFGDMFFYAVSFNQPLNWDTSNGLYFDGMFKSANAFNQDISGWNVSSSAVHDDGRNPFNVIFTGAAAFLNGPYANKTRDCWAHISTHFKNAVDTGISGLTGPVEDMTDAEYDERCGISSKTDNDDSNRDLILGLSFGLGTPAVLGASYALWKYKPWSNRASTNGVKANL